MDRLGLRRLRTHLITFLVFNFLMSFNSIAKLTVKDSQVPGLSTVIIMVDSKHI